MVKNTLLLTWALFFFSVMALSQDFIFSPINDENGLINNYVDHVFEDNEGLIWFGTQGGLNCFDGLHFKSVLLPNQQRDIQMSFARQFISHITQDQQGNLWLGSLTGLYKYSPKTQEFIVYEHIQNDSNSLSNNFIEDLLCVDNQIWAATIVGLNRIDIETGQVVHFLHDSTDINSLTNNHIYTLKFDAEGQLWLGTKGGLEVLDTASGHFRHFKGMDKGIDANSIRALLFDLDSNLWAAASFEGLYFKSKGDDFFKRKPVLKNGKEIQSPFSSMIEDGMGNIWIGTNGDGLIVYEKKTGNCTFYSDNLPSPHNICSNSIDQLSRDRSGNIWISTHGGGASVYKPFNSSIQHYTKNNQTGSLCYNIVSCFEEDSDGNMWIGTDGGGISLMTSGKVSQFQTFDKSIGLSSNAVLSIKEIESGLLAISTWNGGLNLFNTRSRKFEHYYYDTDRSDAKVQDIFYLYLDKEHNELWCCTYYEGIQVFDINRREFISNKRMAERYYNWNKTLFCHKLMFDNNGILWVVEGQGIFKLDKKSTDTIITSDSISFYRETAFATDICQLNDGTIWATNHKGLYQYYAQADTFLLVENNENDFADAKSLLQDRAGSVWVTTAKSLFRYSQIEHRFYNLSQYWSIPSLQYYQRSSYRDSKGNVYFGSLKGFVVLNEDSSYNTLIKPHIFVTRIQLHSDGKQLDNTTNNVIDATYRDSIILLYNQSFFTVEYAATNYIDNVKMKFRYRLYGFDKDWSDGNSERKATYTNIPPGKYIFELICTDSQGKWINEPKQLYIIILPPWWETWWFILIMIFIAISFVVFIIFRREKAIKLQNKFLENVVKVKTGELIEKNNVLTEQKKTIESSYEKLRENQLVIEIKNVQLQEALNTKDKLLTVIAHDFKNPLNTMQGLALLLRNKIYSAPHDDLKQNIDTISSSAASLMSQMIEVLDWSVCSEDSIQYLPEHTNLEVLLLDVLSLTNETALQKNISIHTVNNSTFSAFVDPRQISTVLRNLVINSLKFTPKKGSINISIVDYSDYVRVTVCDTGQGMNAEQIDAIMTSKKLLSSDYQSGFGLQICKTFISRNSGSLLIESQEEVGTQFVIDLPKGRRLDYYVTPKDNEIPILNQGIEYPISDKTILIIDDEADVTAYLKEIFSQSYHVILAYNGSDGLLQAQKHLPDIILSDINMPNIDGKQLCQQLKNNSLTCHIPVILISGQALPKNQIDGFLHGADDYIVKPFDIDLLRHKVVAILTNRELIIQRFVLNSNSFTTAELPLSVDDKIINDINSIIIDNLTNPTFSVESLAEASSMSRSQLYRKLKAVVGQTPIEYINNLKFAKAMEMIKTGRYRVSEVAYELGFSDVRHFSLSFSKKYGGPPSSFYTKTNNIKNTDDE